MESKTLISSIRENIGKVMVGSEETIDLLLTALIAESHVLIEDVPGMGKTVLAKSLAKSVSLEFSRIQFTPDLLPSDVTGLNYFDQKANDFVFSPGPAFCNLLLADEINRATPRTQSSLLECMGECQITVDGVTRPLSAPFFVIATQNPIETLGTYPLPEAQLDRFLMRISMASPTKEQERAILQRFMKEEPLETLQSVCTREDILALQKQAKEIYIHPVLLDYMIDLVQATRSWPNIDMGVSPRGSLALVRAVRAYALVRGGTLLVNQHDSTLSQKVTILLDCTGIGSAVTDALNETAISIAAELAERMLADGISVSVISNGIDTVDGKMLSTGELTGRNTALYLRRRLARLECRNDLTPMPQLLRTLHDGAHGSDLYVLISKEQKLPVLPDLEALTEGSDAIWILPEDRNMPERYKLTETSKSVEIVRWEV